MLTKYFVEICQHNSKTDAWNFKQTKAFDNLDDATKEFHNQLGTYIGYGDLDHVGVILWDCWSNTIKHECWHKVVEPEPEPAEE